MLKCFQNRSKQTVVKSAKFYMDFNLLMNLNIYIYVHIYIYNYKTIYIELNFKRLASKRIEVLMNRADTRTLYLFLFRLLDII